MGSLSSLPYNFCGTHACDCGKEHVFEVECLVGKGVFGQICDFIERFVPQLGRVAIFYDDEFFKDAVLLNIKRQFRTVCIKTDDDKKSVDKICLPEDTKLIIACGMAVNAAKYKAFTLDLPVVVAALPDFFALSSKCVVRENGLYSEYKVNKPKGIIYDIDYPITDEQTASLFGMVAARLNTAFEYYAASLFTGKRHCPFIFGGIFDAASKAITSVNEVLPKFKQTMIEQAIKLALIGSLEEVETTGETQCALTFDLLSGGYSQGELQFVFAAVLTKLYVSHISNRHSFVPPPDNLFRLEHIAELLGVSEFKALGAIRPQLSGKEAALFEYKIKEYAFELQQKLAVNLSLFASAFRTFKHLYPDGGFFLNDLCGGDISLSIALSPDIIWGDGMLCALKRNGELDAYIV